MKKSLLTLIGLSLTVTAMAQTSSQLDANKVTTLLAKQGIEAECKLRTNDSKERTPVLHTKKYLSCQTSTQQFDLYSCENNAKQVSFNCEQQLRSQVKHTESAKYINNKNLIIYYPKDQDVANVIKALEE